MDSQRYSSKKVGDLQYLVFDSQVKEPVVYVLFFSEVKNKWNNYQVTLTVFSLVESEGHDYVTFLKELWSSFIYIDDKGLSNLGPRILNLLQTCDIQYPIELCYIFGGTIEGRAPIVTDYQMN
jgi:hypothetical protein